MADLLPTLDQRSKESKPKVGIRGIVWGVLSGVVVLALVGVAVTHTLGVFGSTQHSATAAVVATPTGDQTHFVLQVATSFGNDMWHDNGADAYMLLTPQAQAQTTPQKLTASLKPPSNVVVVNWDVDPVRSNIYDFHASVIGDLTVKADNSYSTAITEFDMDQQPDGSWRVATFNFPVP